MNKQDLIALATKHGAYVSHRPVGTYFVQFENAHFEAFAAALTRPDSAAPASAEDRKVYEAIADNYFKDTQRGEPQGLAEFDEAVAVELRMVSSVPYNSQEICQWFSERVRQRLAARASAGRANDTE